MKRLLKTFQISTLVIWLVSANSAYAEQASPAEPGLTSQKQQAHKIIKEKQTQLEKDGIDVVIATEKALQQLEQNNSKAALTLLNAASEKLTALSAKANSSPLVPVSFQEQTQVFEGSLDDVKQLADKADNLIDDQRLQEARHILDNLVSEIRINLIELPLNDYPAAIAKAKEQIANQQENQAKLTLANVLDRLVAHIEIFPLPVLAAETDLTAAFELEHKTDWKNPEEKAKILALVDNADYQIKLAEALGYGKKEDFKTLTESIKALRDTLHTSKFEEAWKLVKANFEQLKTNFMNDAR